MPYPQDERRAQLLVRDLLEPHLDDRPLFTLRGSTLSTKSPTFPRSTDLPRRRRRRPTTTAGCRSSGAPGSPRIDEKQSTVSNLFSLSQDSAARRSTRVLHDDPLGPSLMVASMPGSSGPSPRAVGDLEAGPVEYLPEHLLPLRRVLRAEVAVVHLEDVEEEEPVARHVLPVEYHPVGGVEELGDLAKTLGVPFGVYIAPCLLDSTSLSPLLKRKTLIPSSLRSHIAGSGFEEQPCPQVELDRLGVVLLHVVLKVALLVVPAWSLSPALLSRAPPWASSSRRAPPGASALLLVRQRPRVVELQDALAHAHQEPEAAVLPLVGVYHARVEVVSAPPGEEGDERHVLLYEVPRELGDPRGGLADLLVRVRGSW